MDIQTLATQADEDVYALKKLNKTVGGLPVSLPLDILQTCTYSYVWIRTTGCLKSVHATYTLT